MAKIKKPFLLGARSFIHSGTPATLTRFTQLKVSFPVVSRKLPLGGNLGNLHEWWDISRSFLNIVPEAIYLNTLQSLFLAWRKGSTHCLFPKIYYHFLSGSSGTSRISFPLFLLLLSSEKLPCVNQFDNLPGSKAFLHRTSGGQGPQRGTMASSPFSKLPFSPNRWFFVVWRWPEIPGDLQDPS